MAIDLLEEMGIEEVPKEWKIKTLSELFDVQHGISLTPMRRTKKANYPMLRTSNIYWGRINIENIDYSWFSEREIELLKPIYGDLFVCEGGDIGRTAIWRNELSSVGFQNHLHRLRKKSAEVSPQFYAYWMQFAVLVKGIYVNQGNKTTIPNLSQSRLKGFHVLAPPFEEQLRISYILSKLQNASDSVEKTINLLNEIKRSLLHKLFSEGVEHEELIDTEIGPLPANWKIKLLGDLVKFTKKPRGGDLDDIQTPFIAMNDLSDQKIEISGYKLKNMDEITSGVYCEKGDLLLAKITPSFENGKAGILENLPTKHAYATTEIYPFKVDDTELNKYFLFYFLKRQGVRRELANKMEGSTGRKRLPKDALLKIHIPLPTISEQVKISDILRTVDDRITIEEQIKYYLRRLFESLLDKLMTGELRVNDLVMG